MSSDEHAEEDDDTPQEFGLASAEGCVSSAEKNRDVSGFSASEASFSLNHL